MKKTISPEEAHDISQQAQQTGEKVVLIGGCFDILHIAHIKFFEKAKQIGDKLFVLLESDEKIKELKGEHRPFHTQSERAQILAAISFIDYVVLLPYMTSNTDYDKLVESIHPNIIAVTARDSALIHKQRQAHNVGAKIREVIQYIPQKSTTEAIKALLNEM